MLPKNLQTAIKGIKNNYKKRDILPFLTAYRNILIKFLKNKITPSQLSQIGLEIFILDEEFFDIIKKIDSKVLELRKIIDITKPDWDKKEQINYIKHILSLTNGLIKFYKY